MYEEIRLEGFLMCETWVHSLASSTNVCMQHITQVNLENLFFFFLRLIRFLIFENSIVYDILKVFRI